MLTAAAVGSSRSVVEFLPAAVHSAIVAFRTGLYAWEVGWRIEKQDCFTAWSMIVPGATPAAAAEAIEEFTKAKVYGYASRLVAGLTSGRTYLVSLGPTLAHLHQTDLPSVDPLVYF